MPGKTVQADTVPSCPHHRYPTLVVRDLLTGQDTRQQLSLQYAELLPGGETLPHTHPWDEITFVIDGHGLSTLGEARGPAGPGTCRYAPAGVLHGYRNTGDKPMRMLAIALPAMSRAEK